MTEQPVWKLLANLGDASPVDYAGLFVYADASGVYPEESEKLVSPDSDSGEWIVYRYSINRLEQYGADSILIPYGFSTRQDLPYPIETYSEWFNSDLASVASFIGSDVITLRNQFCSSDPLERARAYEAIGDYHGFENLDSYPLQFTNRAEVESRYQEKNK